MKVHIRKATPDDAQQVAEVLNSVIQEGKYSAFSQPFREEEERSFITSLKDRSTLLAAEVDNKIVGVQVLDLFVDYSESMQHVATMGTWILPDFRGRNLGRLLAEESFKFARSKGYEKIIIQVLAGNERALGFYRHLGFKTIGTARRHIKLDGQFYDALYLEKFLTG